MTLESCKYRLNFQLARKFIDKTGEWRGVIDSKDKMTQIQAEPR